MLLFAFGLLVALLTVTVVRITRDLSLVDETEYQRENLKIIASDISRRLDENDADRYAFLETVAAIEAGEKHYSMVLRDTSGMIISPSFVAGSDIPMSNIRNYDKDPTTFMATVWNVRCYVITYAFPDRPLELVAIYDDGFLFDDFHEIIYSFIGLVAFVFLFILLLAWFWIIPVLDRVYARKNRAENELDTARKLQQKAVTKVFPEDQRCDVHAVLLPAREVGGDIYRCQLADGKLFFVVGDVSDKGVAAAFVMVTLSSVIQSYAARGASLVELMNELNRILLDNPDYEMFCTLFMGVIDLDTLEMEYCNAGHTKTLVDGAFLEQDPQLIAGIKQDYPYHTQSLQLRHGSRLLLYTDGVTEARNEARAFYGEQRLLAWMRQRPAEEPASGTCEALLDELASFRGKALQNDDIAIMCIKI